MPAHTLNADRNFHAIHAGWGLNANKQAPTDVLTPKGGVATYVEVACGNEHSCALNSDGKIDCWGLFGGSKASFTREASEDDDDDGAIFVGSLSCGYDFTCALRSDGLTECWGTNSAGQLPSVSGPNNKKDATSSPTTTDYDDCGRFTAGQCKNAVNKLTCNWDGNVCASIPC